MIFIFGFSLIYWTGILTGIFFILSFLGCRCHHDLRICKLKGINELKKNHKIIIYLALIFFIIHVTLAILARYGAGI